MPFLTQKASFSCLFKVSKYSRPDACWWKTPAKNSLIQLCCWDDKISFLNTFLTWPLIRVSRGGGCAFSKNNPNTIFYCSSVTAVLHQNLNTGWISASIPFTYCLKIVLLTTVMWETSIRQRQSITNPPSPLENMTECQVEVIITPGGKKHFTLFQHILKKK